MDTKKTHVFSSSKEWSTCSKYVNSCDLNIRSNPGQTVWRSVENENRHLLVMNKTFIRAPETMKKAASHGPWKESRYTGLMWSLFLIAYLYDLSGKRWGCSQRMSSTEKPLVTMTWTMSLKIYIHNTLGLIVISEPPLAVLVGGNLNSLEVWLGRLVFVSLTYSIPSLMSLLLLSKNFPQS